MFNSNSNTMIILILIGIISIIAIKYFVIKTIYDRIRISKLNEEELKFDLIRPIYKKLKKGEVPNLKAINKKSKKLEYRILIFDVLSLFNKIDIFPNDLLTIEKSSESYLANWLDMHNKYESIPDEIILEDKLKVNNKTTVLVYKFKNYPDRKWLIAYISYETSLITPYLKPNKIFSNFKTEILKKTEIENLI